MNNMRTYLKQIAKTRADGSTVVKSIKWVSKFRWFIPPRIFLFRWAYDYYENTTVVPYGYSATEVAIYNYNGKNSQVSKVTLDD